MARRGAWLAVMAVAAVVAGSEGSAQEPPAGRPVILSVTLRPDTGTLVVSGRGLGPDVLVEIDGQTVTTLPGATERQIEVQAPVSVLTTPGTYRLTVVDPVRRGWDGFIVASAPVVPAVPVATVGPLGEAAGTAAATRVPAPDTTPPGPATSGPAQLAVIEDPGSPWRTAVGHLALGSNTTGNQNTAVGYSTLANNTAGSDNTAIGVRALEASNANNNTAVGYYALGANSSGSWNTAVGKAAARLNTTGYQNTAVGMQALFDNVSGINNVAIGVNALSYADSGSDNTAVGHRAGQSVTTGSNNIFLGADVTGTAADDATIRIGSGQTATYIAGIRGTTVSGEGVYINWLGQLGSGPVVPANNTVGSSQVIVDSLTAADLAAASVGTSEIADAAVTTAKVAFPYAGSAAAGGPASDLACAGCVAASEVSFAFAGLGANTFQGTQVIGTGNLDLDLSSSTEGNITKRGLRFLHDRGTRNAFLGANAGNFTVTSADNAAFGASALFAIGSGGNNTATGSQAQFLVSNGSGNTSSGYRSLFNTTTGGGNTAVGNRAGENNTTGSHNIYLGADVVGSAADANTLRLGLPFDGGTGTGQNRTFIAGIVGAALTSPVALVYIDADGQLGTIPPPPVPGGVAPAAQGAIERRLADQEATIADLRARLARLEGQLAARPRRR